MPSRNGRIRANPSQRPRGIRARKEAANRLFQRGYTNAEVARAIGVTADTAKRYRDAYLAELREEATANPHLLREVINNTIQALRGIDDARAEAWDMAQSDGIASNVKAQYLGLVLKAEKQRAEVLGLLGVKTETAALFGRIRQQQDQLIEFMRSHLCDTDRQMLDRFITEQFADDLRNVNDLNDLMNS